MAIKDTQLTTDVSSSMDEDYVREGERRYLCWSDLVDDENYVRTHFGDPAGVHINSIHPTDTQQVCINVSARCMGRTTWGTQSTMLWECTARFGLWNPLEHTLTGNPINLPMTWRLEPVEEMVPAIMDVNGVPICNSAGDFYDPSLERESVRYVLTVSRNEASPSLATILPLANVVNLAVWNGFPPRTVRFKPLHIPKVEYSQNTSTYYYPMEYVFEINFDTHVVQVFNHGMRQLDPAGNIEAIRDSMGQPVSEPVPLDEAGHAILTPPARDSAGDAPAGASAGLAAYPPGGAQPPQGGTGGSGGAFVFNAYNLYRTYDFSNFNMDNLFTLPAGL